jgi:phosphomannomutase
MPIVRSISGLRATISDCMTDELVSSYCRAFNEVIPPGPIVIGRDGRPSGLNIERLCIETLVDCGREVRVVGIVPTPTVQLLTEHSDAVGGIVITASHNPIEWNGMKFIGADGVFLNKEENTMLWAVLDNQKFTQNNNRGFSISLDNAIDEHIDRLLGLEIFNDLEENFKTRKLRAVVDAVNASGSIIVPKLLEILGIEVIKLYCDESGVFPHTPEPLPENLSALANSVKKNQADLGIAVDPDADRLVLIDENGSPIGEELTIALAVQSLISIRNNGNESIVVNLSTTRVIDDICQNHEATLHRSPVGEINVVNKMRETNAKIGGEGSGGVILSEFHYGRDSLAGIALVILLLSGTTKTLSELCAGFPRYFILKNKFDFTGDIKDIVERILIDYPSSKINTEDGIRIDFEKSWVQLRTSNTEPIVRIIAEAPTNEECRSLTESFSNYL